MNMEKRVQRNQVIIAEYNGGMKIRDIALKFDLSEVSISKIIKAGRMVGQVTSNRRVESSERNQQMAAMYRSGMTMEAIAHEYELSRERVRQILFAQGVVSRSIKEASDAAYSQWVEDFGDSVNRMFDSTLSIRATIQAMPSHHPTWVRRFLEGRKYEVIRTNTVEKFWTEERLLAVLVDASYGGIITIPRYQKWRNSGATFEGRIPPTHAVIVWTFGSWNKALALAGLTTSDRKNNRVYTRTWSIDDAYAAVRAYSLESMRGGKRPTFAGYGHWSSKNPGHPSGTYLRVLTNKSWAEVLRESMRTS
jgi:Mor family transcriptional regulator